MPARHAAKDGRTDRPDFQLAGDRGTHVRQSLLSAIDQEHTAEDLRASPGQIRWAKIRFEDQTLLTAPPPRSPQSMRYPPLSVVGDEHLTGDGNGLPEGLAEQEVVLAHRWPHADAGGLHPESFAHVATHERSNWAI
jgi:hypothetical protein